MVFFRATIELRDSVSWVPPIGFDREKGLAAPEKGMKGSVVDEFFLCRPRELW